MRIEKKPVEKTFDVHSELGDFSVTIRQARYGDITRRNDFLSEASLILNDLSIGQEIKQRVNPYEVQRFEAFLTLVECNIESEDEKGEVAPWFKFNNGKPSSQTVFEIAFNNLPPEIAELIHDKVLEVNPQWKASGDMGE